MHGQYQHHFRRRFCMLSLQYHACALLFRIISFLIFVFDMIPTLTIVISPTRAIAPILCL